MKNVVITGSTRGIGFCMAKEFVKAGCNVTISDRSEKSLEFIYNTDASYVDTVIDTNIFL
jgi:NAD(P)-dependent dehydrogenase (short-subunit alcohol dehydrogenase family)